MRRSHFYIVLVLATVFTAQSFAETEMATYQMRGSITDLWDHDVDYFSRPIRLIRTEDTFDIHTLRFNVLRYRRECVQSRRVCVRRDRRGRCIAWRQECIRWGHRTMRVPKRIDINFRDLDRLGENETEAYEIDIHRTRPAGDGEDWVRTWLTDLETLSPVRVLKLNDFRYDVLLQDVRD